MSVELTDLLLKVQNPTDLNTLLSHYERVVKLLGEANAIKLYRSLHETQSIQVLNELEDNDLLENYQ
jgi:hypothetical protein